MKKLLAPLAPIVALAVLMLAPAPEAAKAGTPWFPKLTPTPEVTPSTHSAKRITTPLPTFIAKAPPAPAVGLDAPLSLTWRLDEIITGAKRIVAYMRDLEDAVADANRDGIKLNEAWRETYTNETRRLTKRLAKYDTWYYKLFGVCVDYVRWLIVGYLVVCFFKIGLTYLSPATGLFRLGSFLTNNLPFMGWTGYLSSRKTLL
ncbi:MAG TPA: hypothetical protein VF595_16060 [Tepidisphaeraceae bacterium]